MKGRARRYPVGPDELDLLLLRAALSEGDDAPRAWEEVRQRMGSITRLNGTTYRLLPLLYRNLSEQGVRDPELKRLKGVYRHSWYANQMPRTRRACCSPHSSRRQSTRWSSRAAPCPSSTTTRPALARWRTSTCWCAGIRCARRSRC